MLVRLAAIVLITLALAYLAACAELATLSTAADNFFDRLRAEKSCLEAKGELVVINKEVTCLANPFASGEEVQR